MGALTLERLQSMLAYDAAVGTFCWRSTNSNRATAGSHAGTIQPNGYLRITIDGKRHYAHRLAWLWVYGKWPDGDIDHIDGNRARNPISNLRDVTRSVNNQNQKRARSDNRSSGLLGVTWNARRGKWVAQIQVDGRRNFIGYFDDANAGHSAYLAKKRTMHAGCTI